MPAAAAAPFAEAALAESFAAAAPEMFMATESFIPAAGALGELPSKVGCFGSDVNCDDGYFQGCREDRCRCAGA